MKAPALSLLVSMLLAHALLADDQQPPPAPQTGAERLKQLSLEDLSHIEVTSVSKESTGAFQTPAAISVLTSDDIARSGATNIPDLLRLLPGVEVAQIASDKWAIGIRGFQGYLSRAVQVLIDGRSVYTPLFAGVYWEMQDTLIEDIDRIEVIRGPGGTIWGANAVNGVINIITKNAADTRGSLVAAEGGSVEQGALSARYGAGDDRLAWRAWGKGFTRGPQFHPDGLNSDDWRRAQGGFRLDWKPSPAGSLMLSGSAYSMDAGSTLAISTYTPPALFNLQANAHMSGQNIVSAWRHDFSNGSDIQIRAYFDRTDRADLNYRETRSTFDVDFLHHVAAGAHDIIWGAGVRVSPSHFFETVPTALFTPARDTYSIYSGFVQDSITLIPGHLTAIAGTKLEHNSYSGFEVQPSGRLAWTPTSKQTLWAAVTRAVRTPSRVEEGFQFSAFGSAKPPLYLELIGDGQFTPEKLDGYELGYRMYITNGGFIGFSGFYNRYDDLLSVENRPIFLESSPIPHFVFPLYLRNGIAAQTKGFELSGLAQIASWWRVKPSYSYLHLNAERDPDSDDASTIRQLQGDSPRHKVVVQSIFSLAYGINTCLTYRYVSALPDLLIPAYSTGDVTFSKRLSREVELSVIGQNLMQPHHPEYTGLPGPPVEIRRSAYLKLVWTR